MAVNKPGLYVYEILERVNSKKMKNDRIKTLQEFNTIALRDVLKANFDDRIKFDLPEGEPPFRPGPSTNPPNSLHKASRKLAHFVEGPKAYPKMKRETAFIQLLEGLHPTEAAILIHVKEKKLNKLYRNISRPIVQEAFPGLLPEKEVDIEVAM